LGLRRLALVRRERLAAQAIVSVLAVGLVGILLTSAAMAAAPAAGAPQETMRAEEAAAEEHTAAAGEAPVPAPLAEAWLAPLNDYAQDPLGNRRGLRRLERRGTENVPPVVLLAMADARLRSGQRRAAARLFNDVLARDPGEPSISTAGRFCASGSRATAACRSACPRIR
jgi:hypothetical protein